MEIDGFTFAAQMINFLILVLLLKRFLYGPIVQAMDQRESKIAARLQAAEAKMQAAQQEADRYQQLQQAWQANQDTLRAQAKQDLEDWKQARLQEARTEVDRARQQWQLALQQEQQAFLKHLRHAATQQVCTVIRRALADLAHSNLEQQMLAVFLEQLQTLSTEQQQSLRPLLTQEADRDTEVTVPWVTVQSAFPLPEPQRQQLEQVVRQQLTPEVQFRFEVVPDLISGLELQANGYKLAWSLENYLTTLEDQLSTALEGELHSHAAHATAHNGSR